ncbi:hypothetical protein HID58_015433 [Brassica napus]|uniref:Uncharacterized protein n=1 Tax=Brassica napus TaxID=3708 RepID=A0ABQ8DKE3_BRANA|nr:hypothetical protein HID58_015430 [Brassica napus]KAH0929706.1 hypothetical protein HID58_015433 [Brassica napus]
MKKDNKKFAANCIKYGAKEQGHLCVTYACMGIHVHSVDMNLLPHFPCLHYSISHFYLRLTLGEISITVFTLS